MNVPKNNNLFQRIILEQRGEKSNYFEVDLKDLLPCLHINPHTTSCSRYTLCKRC